MAAVSKLSIHCVFADDTTATISIDNINPENIDIPTIKQKIWDLNEGDIVNYQDKMVSKSGANWRGIDSAKIINTDRTYIF